MHILVVEDSPTQSELHRRVLLQHGFNVSLAANLSEALSELLNHKLSKSTIDAVLLDLNLPDSAGIETFFRVYENASDLPIVVLSSINAESTAVEALQGGAQDYLIKGKASELEIGRCLLYAIERSRVERRLRQSEKRTRLVLENCTDAFISCDNSGLIKDWNRQAEALFGWRREEVIGKTLAETVIPEELQEVHRRDLQRLSHEEQEMSLRRRGETHLLHKDGQRIPVELGLFPIHLGEDSGELCAFVHDISYRKQIEQRMKHLNEELEQRVEERTAELARSNSELQQFAKVASHDLQEPLRAMEGYARLLAKRYKGKLDADGDEFINYILDGVDRMVKLIQSVLVHASIDNSDIKTLQLVDCNDVMEEVLSNLKASIQECGAKINTGRLPTVVASKTELLQLFQNLVSNAIKYSARDKIPEISVDAEENVHEWVFSVEDNGIGIDPKYTEKIFDMFARLHGKTSYSGTGIGLAICKKIVETHGGRIWVQSEPGSGSIFLFTLPRSQEQPNDN